MLIFIITILILALSLFLLTILTQKEQLDLLLGDSTKILYNHIICSKDYLPTDNETIYSIKLSTDRTYFDNKGITLKVTKDIYDVIYTGWSSKKVIVIYNVDTLEVKKISY